MGALETCIRALVAVSDDGDEGVEAAHAAISEFLAGFDPSLTTRLKALRILRIEHFARSGENASAHLVQTAIETRMRLLIEGGSEDRGPAE